MWSKLQFVSQLMIDNLQKLRESENQTSTVQYSLCYIYISGAGECCHVQSKVLPEPYNSQPSISLLTTLDIGYRENV